MNGNQRKVGVLLSYISQGIHILSGILYTPIMLRMLGQSEYGLYTLVSSVVSYLGLLNFGFASSYIRFYSRLKIKNEEREIARLNGMFMTIFLCITVICVFCGFVMLRNIKRIFGDGLTEKEYETAKILMSILILNLALAFPDSVFSTITSAHECFVFQRLLGVLQSLLNPFFTLPLLLLGFGSVGMVTVSAILTVAKLSVNIWYSIKKLHTRFLFHKFQFSLLKEMWIFTFFIFLNQIIDQVNWSVDKFLLGRFSGTMAVAVYGLGAQINTMYIQFSTAISGVFVPKVNRIVAETNDNRELTCLFTKVGRVQFMVMGLILTGFFFFGQIFMFFWGGEGYGESYVVTLFLIIPVTVPLVQNIGIEIQRAKNMHKTRSVVYFLIAVANIFVSIPLIGRFGPVGAAMGTALSLFGGNIVFMNWYYYRYIGLDMVFFWKKIVRIFPALVVPCIAGFVIWKWIVMQSLIRMIAWILIYTAIYSCSMWLLGMNKEEKHMISSLIEKIFRKLFFHK